MSLKQNLNVNIINPLLREKFSEDFAVVEIALIEKNLYWQKRKDKLNDAARDIFYNKATRPLSMARNINENNETVILALYEKSKRSDWGKVLDCEGKEYETRELEFLAEDKEFTQAVFRLLSHSIGVPYYFNLNPPLFFFKYKDFKWQRYRAYKLDDYTMDNGLILLTVRAKRVFDKLEFENEKKENQKDKDDEENEESYKVVSDMGFDRLIMDSKNGNYFISERSEKRAVSPAFILDESGQEADETSRMGFLVKFCRVFEDFYGDYLEFEFMTVEAEKNVDSKKDKFGKEAFKGYIDASIEDDETLKHIEVVDLTGEASEEAAAIVESIEKNFEGDINVSIKNKIDSEVPTIVIVPNEVGDDDGYEARGNLQHIQMGTIHENAFTKKNERRKSDNLSTIILNTLDRLYLKVCLSQGKNIKATPLNDFKDAKVTIISGLGDTLGILKEGNLKKQFKEEDEDAFKNYRKYTNSRYEFMEFTVDERGNIGAPTYSEALKRSVPINKFLNRSTGDRIIMKINHPDFETPIYIVRTEITPMVNTENISLIREFRKDLFIPVKELMEWIDKEKEAEEMKLALRNLRNLRRTCINDLVKSLDPHELTKIEELNLNLSKAKEKNKRFCKVIDSFIWHYLEGKQGTRWETLNKFYTTQKGSSKKLLQGQVLNSAGKSNAIASQVYPGLIDLWKINFKHPSGKTYSATISNPVLRMISGESISKLPHLYYMMHEDGEPLTDEETMKIMELQKVSFLRANAFLSTNIFKIIGDDLRELYPSPFHTAEKIREFAEIQKDFKSKKRH